MANKKIHVFRSDDNSAMEAAQSYCQANNCVRLETTHKATKKFRTLFPNDEIPKQFKECNYDRR